MKPKPKPPAKQPKHPPHCICRGTGFISRDDDQGRPVSRRCTWVGGVQPPLPFDGRARAAGEDYPE